MRHIAVLLFASVVGFSAVAQNTVYSTNGKKDKFTSEELDIEFTESTVTLPPPSGNELAPVLAAFLPSAVDMGFKLTSNALEKRAKKFVAEYTKHKSYMKAGEAIVPNFTFQRIVALEGESSRKPALQMKVEAMPVPNMNGFVYAVRSINLHHSSAKSTKRANTFDYTMEISVSYLQNGEKKVQELAPVAITSVIYGQNNYASDKHRTDIIPLPEGALLTGVSVKMVESNPTKVRAEKVLALWNDHKDSIKTIINNFLPKEEKGESGEDEGDVADSQDASSTNK